jgi:hypothetical protein
MSVAVCDAVVRITIIVVRLCTGGVECSVAQVRHVKVYNKDEESAEEEAEEVCGTLGWEKVPR